MVDEHTLAVCRALAPAAGRFERGEGAHVGGVGGGGGHVVEVVLSKVLVEKQAQSSLLI